MPAEYVSRTFAGPTAVTPTFGFAPGLDRLCTSVEAAGSSWFVTRHRTGSPFPTVTQHPPPWDA